MQLPLNPTKLRGYFPQGQMYGRITQEQRITVTDVYVTIVKKPFSFISTSRTINLANHLKSCKEHNAWLDGQSKTQPIINEEGNFEIAKVYELVFRETTNEKFVLGQLPTSFIESVAWKHFFNKLSFSTMSL